MSPVSSENVTEPVSLSDDAALATGSLEGSLKLRAGQLRGTCRSRGETEKFASLGPA
jgi:hypothetical protein